MKLRPRLILLASAGFLFVFGVEQFRSGHFAWQNWRGYTVFAPAVMATGIVLGLLGLLPPYRRVGK